MLSDDDEVLKTLQEVNFKPREAILITEEEYKKVKSDFLEDEGRPCSDECPEYAKILKYTPNYVEIETKCNDSRFLVLSDNYYPGWRAYVNGVEKKVVRANYNLRGVIVPHGTTTVQFTYDPLSFKIGASISLFTIALIGILWPALHRRRRQPLPGKLF
jgi:uncharacterized membrane protein YfhO